MGQLWSAGERHGVAFPNLQIRCEQELDRFSAQRYFLVVSTVAEIERAIEKLPAAELLELEAWLAARRKKASVWPVPPPNVPNQELERIDTEIEAAFPTRRVG